MSLVSWFDEDCVLVQTVPKLNLERAVRVFPLLENAQILAKLKQGCAIREMSALIHEVHPDAGYNTIYGLDHLFCLHELQVVFGKVDAPLGIIRARGMPRQNPLTRHELSPQTRLVLSRFAYLHRFENELVLDRPLQNVRCVITSPVLQEALWRCSGTPATVTELLADKGEERDALHGLLATLHDNDVLEETSDGQNYLRADEPLSQRAQWSFHELLFHSENVLGYCAPFEEKHNYGACFPYVGRFPESPARHERYTGTRIALPVASEELQQNDVPFTRVLRERQSVRTYNTDTPVTKDELGAFLDLVYRGKANTRKSRWELAHVSTDMETCSSRSYASGGSVYEQELYLAVMRNDEIESGFHYYDPFTHELIAIPVSDTDWERHVCRRYTNMAKDKCPDILFMIAARFQRVTWKYSQLSYSLILKNLGCLYQSMYLVATLMSLAPCGIGGASQREFAALSGQDPYEEGAIGEFVLGRPALPLPSAAFVDFA